MQENFVIFYDLLTHENEKKFFTAQYVPCGEKIGLADISEPVRIGILCGFSSMIWSLARKLSEGILDVWQGEMTMLTAKSAEKAHEISYVDRFF